MKILPGNVFGNVSRIEKPRDVSVAHLPDEYRTSLAVVHSDGQTELLPISRHVASVLIANSMGYQG